MLCPYCLKEIHFSQTGSFYFNDNGTMFQGRWVEDTVGDKTIFSGGRCPSCPGKIVLQLLESRTDDEGRPVEPTARHARFVSLVFPRKHSLQALPPEVPVQYRADYDEACLVLAD